MELLEEMKGQTFTNVTADSETMVFTSESGEQYKFYHSQDCCEAVSIEDIFGDIKDLIGKPLLVCEEVSNSLFETEWENSFKPNEYGGKDGKDGGWYPESHTWTFYKFATINGYVDVRWFGESNGYYSESVDMAKGKDGNWEGYW